jgi:general secretion pathway protein L
MAEYLVIRLAKDSEANTEWISVDGNGTRLGPPAAGSLSDAARDVRDRTVIVLVPAADVLTTSTDIPMRHGSRLLAALPFALEEHLADDVESLHFAAGTRRDNGRLPVAVVAHERMHDWLGRLEDAGIRPSRIVPENYGLARIPGTTSLLVAENTVVFNDGADTEFVMEDVKPSDALAVAGALDDADADEGNGTNHLLVYCDPADEERLQHDWIALRHELSSVDINLLPDGVLPRLAVTVAAGHGVNLLQGVYGPKIEYGALLRPWKTAAVLLIGLGLVVAGAKVADTWRLHQEVAALQAQFTAEYREIRPNDTREIVDPVATVNSLRRSLGSPVAATIFLPTLRQLGLALQENDSAVVETITYRAGVVDVRLNAPDVPTLDNIQKSVSESGRFTAEIKSTDQVGDRISSRIQIQETGV